MICFSSEPKYRDHDYFKEDLYSTCEEAFLSVKTELTELLASLEFKPPSNNSVLDQSLASTASSRNGRNFPKITLPKFSGKYQDWISFRDLFSSMVGSNPDLAPVEKLHYLKTNVTDEAAKLIAGIAVSDENYVRAWDKLTARYENKRVLINTQLDILFALRPVSRRCARELEYLRSTVAEVLEALGGLGADIKSWDYLLVYFVSKRLDPETSESWEMQLKGTSEPPPYDALNEFLDGCVRALENGSARLSGAKRPSLPSPKTTSSARVFTTAAATPCACCGASHFLSACPAYKAKTPEQRRDFVTAKRLCYNCLGSHPVARCTSVKRCLVCRQAHHTTIHVRPGNAGSSEVNVPPRSAATTHPSESTPSSLSPTAPSFNPTQDSSSRVIASTFQPEAVISTATHQTILPTAVIKVLSLEGRQVKSRAFLDQGSQLSCINENTVQRLRLPRRHASTSLTGVGDQQQAFTRGCVTLRFQSCFDPTTTYTVEAHVLSKITGRMPAKPVQLQDASYLHHLHLADPTWNTPGPIDILLGADIYGQLLKEELRRKGQQDPVAQLTTLGWIIFGPAPSSNLELEAAAQTFFCKTADDLTELVHRFWEQETVSLPDRMKTSKDDQYCETHFVSTHSRNEEGRYVVRLPFKRKPDNFGDIHSQRF